MTGENPYAPPEARLADAPAAPGSALKALALGLAADLGGTFGAGILIGLAGLASGVPPEALEALSASPDSWLFWAGGAAGLACSVLGGYVCARVAKRGEMRLAAVLAAISVLFGWWVSGEVLQLGTFLALTLLSIAAVLYGARWGAARNRSS